MTQAKASETKPPKCARCRRPTVPDLESAAAKRGVPCWICPDCSALIMPKPTPPEPPIPATHKTPPPVLSEIEIARFEAEIYGLVTERAMVIPLIQRIAALAAERQKEADAKVADYLAAKLKRDANATSAACEGEPSGMQAACELDACAHALTAFAKELRGGSR